MTSGPFFAATLALAITLSVAPAVAQDLDDRVAGSRAVAKAFGGDVRAQLVAGLKAGLDAIHNLFDGVWLVSCWFKFGI